VEIWYQVDMTWPRTDTYKLGGLEWVL
jgi:hypothetical protein